MADDFEDYDDFYDDGDNYFYVEDGFDLADDLAEGVVPNTNFFDDDEAWDDLSRFEYWNDIEYDSTGMNDDSTAKVPRRKRNNVQVVGRKRKAAPKSASPRKKTKVAMDAIENEPTPIVVFARPDEVKALAPVVDPTKMPSYSILPDWRERYKDLDESSVSGSEFEDDGEGEVPSAEAIKMALQKNLSSLGLTGTGLDQDTLLRLAQSMLSQGEDSEDLLGTLTEAVLGGKEGDEVEEAPDHDFAKWVAGNTSKTGDAIVDGESSPANAVRGTKRKAEDSEQSSKKRSNTDRR